MTENKFEQLLDQLEQGEIDELVVEKTEFLDFREVWLLRENRTSIVGEAGLNGKIIYRYFPKK